MTKAELLDDLMKKDKSCAFYGTGEDGCEVGCSYLSVSDVSTIVTFCSAKFAECGKYQPRAGSSSPPGGRVK